MELENRFVAQAWHGNGALRVSTNWGLRDWKWIVQSQLATDAHLQNTASKKLIAIQSHFRSRPSLRANKRHLSWPWVTHRRVQRACLCPLRTQVIKNDLLCSTGIAHGAQDTVGCLVLFTSLPTPRGTTVTPVLLLCLLPRLWTQTPGSEIGNVRPLNCFPLSCWTCITHKRVRPNLVICNPGKLWPTVCTAPEGVPWSAGKCDAHHDTSRSLF